VHARRHGFTLLEMLVATTIMGIAVTGLLSGLSTATRNAARLRDYDRVVQLSRLRMNDLLADLRAPHNTRIQGAFDPAETGGVETGWSAMVTTAEVSPVRVPNDFALDRIQLEVWWMSGPQRRSFQLETYRRRPLRDEDGGK
jgi:prepilin-type N-terminal cleavage/methylation domain-containing protein